MAARAGSGRADAVPVEVDPEHLALLASGRLAELPEAEQVALLDAVAADPDLVRLVADLSMPGVLEQGRDEPIPIRSVGNPRPWRFALAACGLLAVGLLGWRFADPPGRAAAPQGLELMGPGSGTDPVDAASTRAGWSTTDLLRDGALLALLVACGVLAWPALRDFDKPLPRG